jgi:uncharacterized protein YndB with AHSA1/START domain
VIDARVTVDVDRPPGEVFAYLEDAENNPRWIPNMRVCRWTTPPPVAVGSRYEQLSAFLGRKIRTSFEVTEHEPGHRITIASREGSSFPITVTRIVEPGAGGGSHVTELVEGDASSFDAIATPLLRAMVRRNIRRDSRNLKRVLERRSP